MRLNQFHQAFLTLGMLGALAFSACGTSQTISETSVEDRLTRLIIGRTTRSEVESALGTDRGSDANRWLYHLSDSAYKMVPNQNRIIGGLVPILATSTPTNTRAIIAVSFDDAGVLNRLEVERFFDQPFVNDYWFRIKDATKEPMKTLAGIAQSLGYKVADLDPPAGAFKLTDGDASIAVTVQAQTLRLTSKNPYDRLAGEYRVYRKREGDLIARIADSGLVQ